MFEHLPVAEADAIFGLNATLRADSREKKINLVAGVYKDENGQTPVFEAVHRAEARLVEERKGKTYLPIEGDTAFTQRVEELLFPGGSKILDEDRLTTVQTPGGTGALRLAGDLLKKHFPDATVWMSAPTWPNHPQIFRDALDLETRQYPYFAKEKNTLDEDGFFAALENVAAGDVVLLHGCCHNPTGVDLSPAAWSRLAELLAHRGAVPLVDFAYLGFAQGLEEDRAWLDSLLGHVGELFVATSFSKNFGLYNERTAALTVITGNRKQAEAIKSQLQGAARANYSNPPAHGAAIIRTVLGDPELRRLWDDELTAMRARIKSMRELFARGLDTRDVRLAPDGNDFISRQNGMFSFSGLTPEEVDRLRDDHAIYMVRSGRINVAGITPGNVDSLCDAVAAVRSPRPQSAISSIRS